MPQGGHPENNEYTADGVAQSSGCMAWEQGFRKNDTGYSKYAGHFCEP